MSAHHSSAPCGAGSPPRLPTICHRSSSSLPPSSQNPLKVQSSGGMQRSLPGPEHPRLPCTEPLLTLRGRARHRRCAQPPPAHGGLDPTPIRCCLSNWRSQIRVSSYIRLTYALSIFTSFKGNLAYSFITRGY